MFQRVKQNSYAQFIADARKNTKRIAVSNFSPVWENRIDFPRTNYHHFATMYFSHENYVTKLIRSRRCLDTKLPSFLPSFLFSTSSKAKNLSIYNFSTFPGIDVLISSSFVNVYSLATRSSFSSVPLQSLQSRPITLPSSLANPFSKVELSLVRRKTR